MHVLILVDDVSLASAVHEATAALRQRGIGARVLLLADKLSVADRIRALDAGADDVLTLRTAQPELLAHHYTEAGLSERAVMFAVVLAVVLAV